MLLIGTRITHFWAVRRWVPVMLSMPRMPHALTRDPGRELPR